MKLLSRGIIYFFLVIAGLVAVIPFIWLIATSFKGAEEIFSYPPTILPHHFVLQNYSGVWNTVPFGVYFINSVIVVTATVVINLLIAASAGFGLARFRFKGREFFFLIVLGSMMIPKELIIIPLYTTILKLKLTDTLAGVILPFAVDGLSIFMMRQAFRSIPNEIEEAAIMDGCSPFRIWWKIMLPMTKPTLAVLAIFSFIGTWGDFLWPLVVLKSPENYTLQVGLSYMTGTFINNYRYIAAGSVLAVIPVILVFLFAQKYFEKGIYAGIGK